MKHPARQISLILGALFLATAARAKTDEHECAVDDFPTAVVADYVLGCMTANGNTFESLHQCSCSIDFIKERMTYSAYERAQTVMQAQLDQGQRGIFYRDSNWAKKAIESLQSIQAESTLRCF